MAAGISAEDVSVRAMSVAAIDVASAMLARACAAFRPLGVFRIDAPDCVPLRGDSESVLPEGTVATLLDLARSSAEQDFRDLALMSGVDPQRVDELWEGARRRLRQNQP